MEENAVIVFVGVYDSKAEAEADYDDILLDHVGTVGVFDAAVITKDDDGRVHVDKDEKTLRQGALAGAVVGLLFPPLLVADIAIGSLVGHLWGGMSRADMKDLGELLDAGEVALVVVAEVKPEDSLTKRFERASRTMQRNIGAAASRIRKAFDRRDIERAPDSITAMAQP
jgi:uncharacterized membrane protein